MANSNENAPLTELLGGLVSDVTGLLRKEIDLAKTEASEKLEQAMSGFEILIVGMVLAIGAVGVLLAALVSAIAAFLVAQGFNDTSANALASLIVGIVVALISWALISRGIAALRGNRLMLNRTATSLRRDVETVKEKI